MITIKILEDIGVRYAANYARKLGIKSPLAEDLTLGLGSSALSPMELAGAYSVLANGGVRVTPTYINKVYDRDGRILEEARHDAFAYAESSDFRDSEQVRSVLKERWGNRLELASIG